MFRLLSSPKQAEEAESRLGTRLGNYALLEIIGKGGMGVVYEGHHIYIKRRVAVKVMYRNLFEDRHARQRFLHEAQAASRIDHPNVVAVSDFGEVPDGTVFLVMSYVQGSSMETLLRQHPVLPLFRTLGILGQTARALGAAHEQNVIHRDLKPDNIMLESRAGRREVVRTVDDDRGSIDYVEPEGEFDFATVLDFGAATIRDTVGAQQSSDGTVIATPYYMAPETAHHGEADARSDIYALGVIFYRALTGTLPFDGRNPHEIMTKHVYEPVQPPSARNTHVELTDAAERVIMKTLQKDPAHRQQTMEELYADLQRCYGRVRFRRVKNAPEDEVVANAVAMPPRPIRLTRAKRPTGEPPVPNGQSSGPVTPSPPLRSAATFTPVMGGAADPRATSQVPPPLGGRGGTAAGPSTTPIPPPRAGRGGTSAGQPVTPVPPPVGGASGTATGHPLRLTQRKMSTVPQTGARPTAQQPGGRDNPSAKEDSYERHPTLPFGQELVDQELIDRERVEALRELESDRQKTNPYAPSPLPPRPKY